MLSETAGASGWESVPPLESELWREPGSIVTKIKSNIAASDLVVAIFVKRFSKGVMAELAFSRSLAKPTVVFVSQDVAVTLSSVLAEDQYIAL